MTVDIFGGIDIIAMLKYYNINALKFDGMQLFNVILNTLTDSTLAVLKLTTNFNSMPTF